MVEELHEQAVCFSQVNRIYPTDFSNVVNSKGTYFRAYMYYCKNSPHFNWNFNQCPILQNPWVCQVLLSIGTH